MISLGAARYPSAPAFRHTAFGPSSRAIAELLTGEKTGLVEGRDHLNLFDDDRSWPDQLIEARNWIRSRLKESRDHLTAAPENIVVHYVGHGWFQPNSEDHLLTINHTDAEEKAATSAVLGQLNAMFLREAGGLRRFYLIDACFAAASLRDVMAVDDLIEKELGVIIGAWPEDETGRRGVAALCSADKDSLANAGGERALTQFTDGVLAALEKGDANSGDRITLRKLYELLRLALRAKYGDVMVHPVLVAPNDSDGGIAGIPLFTNTHRADRGLAKAAAIVVDFVHSVRDVVAARDAALEDDPTRAGSDPDGSDPPMDPAVREHAIVAGNGKIDDGGPDPDEAIRALETALVEDVTFRRTIYRFFRLPPSKKNAIVEKMKLRRPGDARMNELDRQKAALARARTNGQVNWLEALIGEAEGMQ